MTDSQANAHLIKAGLPSVNAMQLAIDIRGYPVTDRLQFSTVGRELLKVIDAGRIK